MAIDNQFGKGIGVAAGFDLGAQKPLDARIAVNTIAERDAHVENNRAYEGMIVFVDETKKNYQLINGAWQELAKAEQDRLDALEAMLNGGEGAEGGALGALQDDIDALEEKTGIKAEYEENGDVKVAATGMYKYIDDQDAKLQDNIGAAVEGMEKAVAGEKTRAEGQEAAIRGELAQALADAKAHAEAEDVKVKNAQAEKDSSQDNKILALEQKFEGEQSVDNKIAAVQDDLDTFKQSQETAHQGLVQKDGELDQAIKDEAKKAREEEGKLQSAIDAINNAENGILAQAKALDKEDRDAQALVDKAQDDRLKALEDANKDGGAVKEAIDKVAQDLADFEGKQATKNGELVAEDQRLNQAIVDEAARADAAEKANAKAISDEAAAARAAEQALQKAISNEADRAKGEEARIEGLVTSEASRADAEEKRIVGLVEAEAQAARAAEKANADEMTKQKDANQEGTLANKIAANAAAIAQEAADRAAAVSGEATARANADTALDNRLKAVEASIGDGGDLEKRVEANEAAIEIINGEGEGSIKKAVADLINGAPEALNTLDELAAALRDNADVLDAVEEAFDNKLSSQKTALQKEIDDDVKVVADELAKQKDASQAGTLAKQIADEASRAAGQEAAIRGEFAAADNALKAALQKEIDDDVLVETNRAKGVEEGLQDAIDAINDAENGILAQAKAHANGLDQAMDLRMDAVEKFVEEHDHSVMEQGIKDNKDAIEVLNGDVNKDGSVAKAVKVEADRALAAEQAIQKQINEGLKCIAFDGDTEYDDLAPLI